MSYTANIMEIFSSLQGEGSYAGTPTTFVRFAGCDVGCRWCDTPQASKFQESCRIESPPGSENFKEILNPVTPTKLNEIISGFKNEHLSVTGGEPLLQAQFLAEWLSTQVPMHRVLLETSGLHCNALLQVLPYIHIISMDLKLPSSTGLKPMWKEHGEFLRIALRQSKEIYIKIVLTSRTTDRDLQEAIRLITHTNKFLPVILQPASPTLTFHETLAENRLSSLNRIFSAYLPNVSVTPQMHKEWDIL